MENLCFALEEVHSSKLVKPAQVFVLQEVIWLTRLHKRMVVHQLLLFCAPPFRMCFKAVISKDFSVKLRFVFFKKFNKRKIQG